MKGSVTTAERAYKPPMAPNSACAPVNSSDTSVSWTNVSSVERASVPLPLRAKSPAGTPFAHQEDCCEGQFVQRINSKTAFVAVPMVRSSPAAIPALITAREDSVPSTVALCCLSASKTNISAHSGAFVCLKYLKKGGNNLKMYLFRLVFEHIYKKRFLCGRL